jgi:hypothetical protein
LSLLIGKISNGVAELDVALGSVDAGGCNESGIALKFLGGVRPTEGPGGPPTICGPWLKTEPEDPKVSGDAVPAVEDRPPDNVCAWRDDQVVKTPKIKNGGTRYVRRINFLPTDTIAGPWAFQLEVLPRLNSASRRPIIQEISVVRLVTVIRPHGRLMRLAQPVGFTLVAFSSGSEAD